MDWVIYLSLFAALFFVTVMDIRSYQIPTKVNQFIFFLGIIRVVTNIANLYSYLAGFICMGLFLLFFYAITGGKGLGGGDVKLMAACGLIIGLESIFVALFIGCVLGIMAFVVQKLIGMKCDRLALGPYLSAGIMICVLWEKQLF